MDNKQIDEALELVLKAAGASSFKHYMPYTQEKMREAMRQIFSGGYVQTGNICQANSGIGLTNVK